MPLKIYLTISKFTIKINPKKRLALNKILSINSKCNINLENQFLGLSPGFYKRISQQIKKHQGETGKHKDR